LRLQVFGQMTWDIKRVFPYYKRTQVLKDLKTPTPRKTDTSPETTHCHPDERAQKGEKRKFFSLLV
ncbi:hypothetical protein, partial [Varibaculum sp.]|uniref:hypothetical protein n=2 Tax=Varibaculum sp. TaxID=1895474 RepID=UPI0025FF6A17